MIISKVLSYKNAWHKLSQEHPEELQDILEALPEFVEEYYNPTERNNRGSYRELWDKILYKKGWSLIEKSFYSDAGQRVFIGNLGPIKNQVSATVSFGLADNLNRWLFQQTTLAGKYDLAKIPIMLLPAEEYARRLEERPFARASFELYQRQLQPLAPLSHGFPFLILGYSDQNQLFKEEIIELESNPLVAESNIIIDRCIEFPPQYYQAGLNILNFFGTYIREQYPNEDAKVKIEQNGQLVRLIIETQNGEREVIERALEEYQLIISGQKQPEEITKNQKLAIELRSELRLAKYRIETQQDIIKVQQGQIETLYNIVGQGLISRNAINIDFKPVISLNNNNVNHNISHIISDTGLSYKTICWVRN